MDGLVIGIDLCDSYTHISCMTPDLTLVLPTAVCKNKEAEEWYVDKEACRHALIGDGVIEDKLLTRVMEDNVLMIGGVKYEALFILKMFLKRALERFLKEAGKGEVERLTVTVQTLDTKLMDSLMYCADFLKIPRRNVHIISHTESFIYYVMSQKRDVWSNQVGMFDFSDEMLRYFELKVQKGTKQLQVVAECQEPEESMHLNMLDSSSGARLADKVLCSFADRILQKRLFSAIVLTGKGFENTQWAAEFMHQVCSRRRVFAERSLFSKGALYRAADDLQETTSYPFSCICEGRLKSSVSVKVIKYDKEGTLLMAEIGDNWYEARSTADFIVSGQKEVEFTVTPLEQRKKKIVKIGLESFPNRPDRTTRIHMSIGFTDEHTMVVSIEDKGFGEIFKASNAVIKQEVKL